MKGFQNLNLKKRRKENLSHILNRKKKKIETPNQMFNNNKILVTFKKMNLSQKKEKNIPLPKMVRTISMRILRWTKQMRHGVLMVLRQLQKETST
jgi:hypothetical protein